MKSAGRLVSIMVFLGLLLLAANATAGPVISGKVVKVTDGDTITVLVPGNQQIKVRLYGIDCPEKKQAFGQRARKFTTYRVAGKNMEVEILDTDRYGRSVGIVRESDGSILNRQLISNGLAWVYTRYCKAAFCPEWEQEEIQARKKRIGLWVDPPAMPPWEWRKAKKN